jgi:hypothetical protein
MILLVVENLSSSERKCIIRLRKYCVVYEALSDSEREKYGSKEFIVTFCGMCIKSYYAKAKMRLVNKFSVVNTL